MINTMKKIIFVDDDEFIQQIVTVIFENLGFQVIVLTEGTSLLDDGYDLPDIFILDKQLPSMDGLTLCRRLKGQDRTKDIPVIMISATPGILKDAKAAGADDVLEKPFSVMKIREMVANLLDGKGDS